MAWAEIGFQARPDASLAGRPLFLEHHDDGDGEEGEVGASSGERLGTDPHYRTRLSAYGGNDERDRGEEDEQLCHTRHVASPAESCVTTSLKRRDADPMIRTGTGEGQQFSTKGLPALGSPSHRFVVAILDKPPSPSGRDLRSPSRCEGH